MEWAMLGFVIVLGLVLAAIGKLVERLERRHNQYGLRYNKKANRIEPVGRRPGDGY